VILRNNANTIITL